MAGVIPMPRRRGGVSGLMLVLLGLWSGVAPFIGAYFSYGYSPDSAWTYTQGRLLLSAVPGGVALVCGLIVMFTRSRGLGGLFALVAALAGAWLVLGAAALAGLAGPLHLQLITPGLPLAGSSPARQALDQIGMFSGAGALIVFFAALALGRFSVAAARDAAAAAAADAAAETAQAAETAAGADSSLLGQPYEPYTSVHTFVPDPYAESSGQYPTAQTGYPADDDLLTGFSGTEDFSGADTGGLAAGPDTTAVQEGDSDPEAAVGAQPGPMPGIPGRQVYPVPPEPYASAEPGSYPRPAERSEPEHPGS